MGVQYLPHLTQTDEGQEGDVAANTEDGSEWKKTGQTKTTGERENKINSGGREIRRALITGRKGRWEMKRCAEREGELRS